jgi:[acyl-carrier-protein] S-malonyltransferase
LKRPESDEGVVALVAGTPITINQVRNRLASVERGPLASLLPKSGPEHRRGRRWVLRLLVTEALVSHHAGFTTDQSSNSEANGISVNGIDNFRATELADAAQRLFDRVTSGIYVSEEELRGYYTRNLDRYQLPERRLLRHRWEKSLQRAQLAAGRLADDDPAGTRFEMRRGEFAGPFEEAAFAAHVGEVIGPIESELGWHVALVEAIFESGYAPYERVRSDIETDLLSVARGRAFDQWLEQQRRALAVVAPGWGHPGDPSLPDFSHRH